MPKNPPKTKITAMIEWSALLSALIVLGLSLIISTIIIVGSQRYHSKISEQGTQQRRKLAEIAYEHEKLQKTLKLFKEKSVETFNQLKKAGFFQDDSNSTIEGIIDKHRWAIYQEIGTLFPQLLLFKEASSYSLQEKKRYTAPEFLEVEEQLKVYEIPISFELGVLHEGDLLKSIKEIESLLKKSDGLFNMHSCDIKRNRNKISVKNIEKPYFMANCVWTWYISWIETDDGKTESTTDLGSKRIF
jgi:hypothetical protein